MPTQASTRYEAFRESSASAPAREALQRLAWLLDNSIRLPGTQFRIGLDALLGLFPVVGDAAGVVLSGYIVQQAAKLGAPTSVLFRMVLNVAIEGLLGAVPLAGDIFDAAWKANQRNVALLDQYLDRPGPTRTATRAYLFLLLGMMVLLVLLVSLVAFLMVDWIWGAFASALAR